MSTRALRRRALVLLALALACGGLAASEVSGRIRTVEAQVGRPVSVLVTSQDVEPGAKLGRADLASRRIPQRFLPPGALNVAGEAVGARAGPGGLPRGTYVTSSVLARASRSPAGEPAPLRDGERAVEVAVAGGVALAERTTPGSRVDVVVSTEAGHGGGRAFLALEYVELLGLRAGVASGGRSDGPPDAASAIATLRVTVRQAVYLTAAQDFGRDVRLLPRAAGDRRRTGRAAYAAGDL